MTSYANDTTTTTSGATAAAAATTSSEATSGGVATAVGAGASADPSKAKGHRDNLSIGRRTTGYGEEDDGNSSDGREKADTTPENIKKIAEIMEGAEDGASPTSPALSPRHVQLRHPVNPGFVGLGAAIDESSGKFCLGKPPPSPAERAASVQSRTNHSSGHKSTPAVDRDDEENSSESNTTTTATKQALAFTIDHFDASENDAAAQAARYKNMMERFQNRHKRGASMSKLETDNTTTTTNTTSNSGRHSQRSSLDAGSSMADDISSLTAATPNSEQAPPTAVKMRVRDRSASRVRDASKRHSWSPRSSANGPEPTTAPTAARPAAGRSKLPPPPAAAKGTSNSVANRTTNQFTPRSTAMQLALRQVEMLCPQPPLADGKSLAENDAVSEAGTYTLDGDNYTEEQKDLMNIDRNAKEAAAKLRPKQLPVKANRGSNVLEVNYYHETPLQEQQPQQLPPQRSSTGAYLDQLKSRVLRQQVPPSPPTPPSPAADVGCFTSVTTSGVLAKQRALDTHPKLTRHTHSLSTSQIDSSEYVSNEAKLRHTQALAGSATDRQKAEYRLNVFTTSTSQPSGHHQLPETPTTPTQGSEAALLQTAQTKQDWIQEWARNARARSLAQDVNGTSASRRKQQQQQQQQQVQQLMTRSYNCSDTGGDSLTDDSLSLYNQQRQYAAAAKLNRSLAERYRLMGDCDYASDPALCSHGGQVMEPPYKPPKSPSKIPSPLHTLGRARSASRSRPPTDAYLEQTAAAISNLQQSLSRRSSIKSPAQGSPQHSLESGGMGAGAGGGYRRSPLHRALMTSSINEAQLQLLTSGEYLLKQLRRRKNSLEYDPGQEVEQPEPVAAPLSPLRRSSSFQQQQGQQHPVRQARPNFQNLYTPPAARHAHALSTAHQQQQLKKSASSNNFEQTYSDYDNELQYYINDEDEMGTSGAYYSSNEEEEEVPEESQGSVPLSNTRMNKALLMRIERSKQRVAGGQTPAKPTSAPAGKLSVAQQSGAGLVACPNTPEMPRRGIKSAPRAAAPGSGNRNTRQSMPRETSLSRLAQQVPSSLANAKKQLLQTANAGVGSNQRVQPKYLDISKYKPVQSNNFLRKNDSKSTLKPSDPMKRSPSASSMGLTRGDGTRASNRSVRSMASAMNTSTTSLGGGNPGARASSSVRRDASVNKQKEAEMAMWKRRSTYDPMKAAAEDRRKKEEARRAQTQVQRQINDVADEVPFESVLRPANNLTITGGGIGYSPRNSMENDAWTLGESSEFGEYPDDYDENDEEVDEEEIDYVGQESDEVFEAEPGGEAEIQAVE
ncbi:uncharacterized protein LOC6507879 isoform X1 [Drosophila ananassae]|uniref:uncharacterized protein LOC6507879 isoform X1 n=1 Tax=Drosophila ananassae TaxID=7217 RepID=UPI0013A5C174|nr:uncharacterized protein LOC6507879 isoform X1 [Drosophila ananassae]XP_032309519.1 uncharacterized protein LOC6507879 isoform X1 [Drosophila ananassae]XP_032309520.1 uncharacterized protein LOC6507879 isoform X1 [Drosophila ananassae]XP_032309521.1 uncharacterized protein LOC6507879 isoform X1 [Drosophila ananassae]XP_032309522.1 uncharacterized protein LOC6507879 isoform X1 [Drosophila ananassae]